MHLQVRLPQHEANKIGGNNIMMVDAEKLQKTFERMYMDAIMKYGLPDRKETDAILNDAIKRTALCKDCDHPQDSHWADTDHCIYPLGYGVVCGCDAFKPEGLAK